MVSKTFFTAAVLLLGPQLVGTVQAQSSAPPDDVAGGFADDVKTLIAKLNVDTEDFAIRINRCQGKFGEFPDEIYTVWIGWRGVARDGTAGARLAALRSHWTDSGWKITRSRELDNGGINLAALEPVTGNLYILDSGFDMGPESYIVGYFNTPCFSNPTGDTQFGAWSAM